MIGEADPKNAEAAKKIRDGYVELMDGDVKLEHAKLGSSEGSATGNETSGKKAKERGGRRKA